MKVRADIKCHACGFVSGEVIGESLGGTLNPRQSRIRAEHIVPSALCPKPWPITGRPVRCGRCGGNVYLDDMDVVKEARADEEHRAAA